MRPIVARDVMTPEVLCVSESLELSELAAFLVNHQITGAAVKNSDDEFVGVVSATDVVAAAAESGERLARTSTRPRFYAEGWEQSLDDDELRSLHLNRDRRQVRDVMTSKIYSVPADAPAAEVARIMLKAHIHRLLVTEGDEIVGVISTSDMLGLLVDEPEGAGG